MQKLQELLDAEYHQKLEENKKLAEQVTAKKRAKRLKKKQGRKQKKQMKTTKENNAIIKEKHSEQDSSDENEETSEEHENEETRIVENEETRIVKTHEEHEDDKGNYKNPKNIFTLEDESEAADRSQKNISKISIKVTSENSQYKNGT